MEVIEQGHRDVPLYSYTLSPLRLRQRLLCDQNVQGMLRSYEYVYPFIVLISAAGEPQMDNLLDSR